MAPCVLRTIPTVPVVPSVQLVHFIQDLLNFIQYIIYYFTILIRAQAQIRRRIVEEYTNSDSAGNNNPPDTSNKSIYSALNNLAQALATLQADNTSTGANSNHSPVLNHFEYDLTFELYSHAGSTEFQLSCALLDVTWGGDVDKFPPLLVAIKKRVIEMHWEDGTAGITNVNRKEMFCDYKSIYQN